MFKKISLLFGLIAALPVSAHAWVGGPFDGGDHSASLDDTGIYQSAFRFKNGSGYSQFGTNVSLGPNLATSGSTTSASTSIGTVTNRTILYYEGVMFFGNASGVVDHQRGEVSGFSNTYSEVSLSASSSSSDDSGTSSVSASNSVVFNGLGFTANLAWKANITTSHPELRYAGKGELVVISPSASQIVSNAVQTLIESVEATDAAEIGFAINQITQPNVLDALSGTTVESLQEQIVKVPVTVYGARKFFLSTR